MNQIPAIGDYTKLVNRSLTFLIMEKPEPLRAISTSYVRLRQKTAGISGKNRKRALVVNRVSLYHIRNIEL